MNCIIINRPGIISFYLTYCICVGARIRSRIFKGQRFKCNGSVNFISFCFNYLTCTVFQFEGELILSQGKFRISIFVTLGCLNRYFYLLIGVGHNNQFVLDSLAANSHYTVFNCKYYIFCILVAIRGKHLVKRIYAIRKTLYNGGSLTGFPLKE